MEFGQEEEEEEEDAEAAEAEDSIEPIPGIQRLLAIDDQHQLTDDECHIVYQQPLLNLARLRIDNSCNFYGCDQYVDLQHESIGSAIYIKWVIFFFFFNLVSHLRKVKCMPCLYSVTYDDE